MRFPSKTAHPRAELNAARQDLISTMGWSPDEAMAFINRVLWSGGPPLVELVQQELHDERVHTTWPPCRLHPNHPYVLRHVGDEHFWACPRDNTLQARVGELPGPTRETRR